jgi:hypothetical protein
MVQDATTIKQLKADYIGFFKDCPIQRYAADYIGRDEDTIIRWRKNDPDFSEAVKRAKADWVRKKVMQTKAEFALERLESEIFGKTAADVQVNIPAPQVYLPEDLPESYFEQPQQSNFRA